MAERKDLQNIKEGIELYMTYGDGVNPISVTTEPYKGGYAAYKIGPDSEGNIRTLGKTHLDANMNPLD